MLSRTARLAAILTVASAALTLIAPRPAAAASRFSCGETGDHFCCIPSGDTCSSGIYCCYYSGDNPQIIPCGCG